MILPFHLVVKMTVIHIANAMIELQRGEGVRIHREKEGRR